MNSQYITQGLLRGKWRQNFCLPRYTPKNWFECDVFEVTKAGYFVEYEIKITVSDFKADAAKVRAERWDKQASKGDLNKHQMLANGDLRSPNRFYFVTPIELLGEVAIPIWAGLLVAEPWADYPFPMLRQIKEAPKLHRQKLAPEILTHAQGVCYYRMHGLMWKAARIKS